MLTPSNCFSIMPEARFTFYGALNDFLLPRDRDSQISYSFTNMPAIKDAIEAIGIPHVEVKEISINGHPVGFYHPLQDGDTVEAYPFATIPLTSAKFILDVHLGKLARLLRLLGFDTLYENKFSEKAIAATAKQQNRIVLTRDVGLLKYKSIEHGYWLRSQEPLEQVKEIVEKFALKDFIHPFTRCMVCNGIIERVAKEKILDQLPPATAAYFNEFYQCQNCKRIYWKGSHYERMMRFIESIER